MSKPQPVFLLFLDVGSLLLKLVARPRGSISPLAPVPAMVLPPLFAAHEAKFTLALAPNPIASSLHSVDARLAGWAHHGVFSQPKLITTISLVFVHPFLKQIARQRLMRLTLAVETKVIPTSATIGHCIGVHTLHDGVTSSNTTPIQSGHPIVHISIPHEAPKTFRGEELAKKRRRD